MKALVYVSDGAMLTVTDSAVTVKGQPVFLPEGLSERWELRVGPAFLVGRLGKCIEPRFALRHIEAMGVALWLRPVPVPDGDLGHSFDGALTLCCRQPLGPVWALEAGDLSLEQPLEPAMTAELVSRSSEYITLRQGDALVPATLPLPFYDGGDLTLPVRLGDLSFTFKIR